MIRRLVQKAMASRLDLDYSGTVKTGAGQDEARGDCQAALSGPVVDLEIDFMNERLFFDEMEVGDRWESPSRTVTESDVTDFAGLTGDFDPLHMDPEYARNTPFGRPIAHGLLGLSFVAGLSSKSPAVHTVAFTGVRDWRFLQPIFFGDTVHVVTEVVEKSGKGRRRGTVLWRRKLLNDAGQLIQEGEFETIVQISPDRQNRTPKETRRPGEKTDERQASA